MYLMLCEADRAAESRKWSLIRIDERKCETFDRDSALYAFDENASCAVSVSSLVCLVLFGLLCFVCFINFPPLVCFGPSPLLFSLFPFFYSKHSIIVYICLTVSNNAVVVYPIYSFLGTHRHMCLRYDMY